MMRGNTWYSNPCILIILFLAESWKCPDTLQYGLKILKEIFYAQNHQTSCSHFAGIMQIHLEIVLDWPSLRRQQPTTEQGGGSGSVSVFGTSCESYEERTPCLDILDNSTCSTSSYSYDFCIGLVSSIPVQVACFLDSFRLKSAWDFIILMR